MTRLARVVVVVALAWAMFFIIAIAGARFVMAQEFSLTAPTQFNLPQTIDIHDATGKVVASGTVWGNKMVLRNLDGELIGTVAIENGRRNFYDPHGKQIDADQVQLKFKLPDKSSDD